MEYLTPVEKALFKKAIREAFATPEEFGGAVKNAFATLWKDSIGGDATLTKAASEIVERVNVLENGPQKLLLACTDGRDPDETPLILKAVRAVLDVKDSSAGTPDEIVILHAGADLDEARRVNDRLAAAFANIKAPLLVAAGGGTEFLNSVARARTVFVCFGQSGPVGIDSVEVDVLRCLVESKRVKVVAINLPGLAEAQSLRKLDDLLGFGKPFALAEILNDDNRIAVLRQYIGGQPEGEEQAVAPLAPPPASGSDTRSKGVVEKLLRELGRRNITLLVGEDVEWEDPQTPAGSFQLTRLLINRLIGDDKAPGTPAPAGFVPSFDNVSAYCRVKDAALLEENLVQIAKLERAVPPTYQAITKYLTLAKAWIGDRATGRKSKLTKPDPILLITTNFDVLLEYALLDAELPFTRVVQQRSEDRFFVNQYRELKSSDTGITVGVESAAKDKPQEIVELIRDSDLEDYDLNQLSDSPPWLEQGGEGLPIVLYKYHGSGEFPESCVTSTQDYYDLALDSHGVPDNLKGIIKNTNCIAIGYCLLDSEFQNIASTMYPLENTRGGGGRPLRYAVRAKPPPERGQVISNPLLEHKVWSALVAVPPEPFDLLQEEPVAFLERLCAGLK